MGRRFKSVGERLAIWLVAIIILAGSGAGAGWVAFAPEAPVRYSGVVRIELPLPPGFGQHGPAGGARAAGADDGDRVAADLALLEDGPLGPLPRIAPDGRRPFLAYAGLFNLEDRRPKVAVLLVGLGLQRELLDAALVLPPPISLQFSPYASDLPALVNKARRAGHEVLLDLPMESGDYLASDPGPHALLAGGEREENLKRLNWVLARATGYVALAGGGARFAKSEQVATILDVLARRGLAFVELGDRGLASAAAAAGLPYVSARLAIDEEPSVLAIDHALAALEAQAWAAGSALGVAQLHPVSLERLRVWTDTLEAKGLVLAPVSAVLIEQAGLARELSTDGRRASARSEG